MAQAAFKAAADLSVSDILGRDLLKELAAPNPDLKILQQLIDAGANIEARDDKQNTPLLFAARHKKNAALELLVKNKAALGARGNDNATAMYYALAHYNNAAVKALLQGGLDPEQDVLRGGLTALMWAANLGKYDLAALLTEHGGDPYRKNLEDGQTAIDYASKKPFIQQSMETIYNRKAAEREKAVAAAAAKVIQDAADAEKSNLNAICKQGLPTSKKLRALHPPKFKSFG